MSEPLEAPPPGRRAPRSRRRGCLAALLVAVLALLFARAFLGDVYRVESVSMEPCLRQGEWVLVRYERKPPRRWELVVLTLPGEPDPMVKRVVGLPRERVQLTGGDVLIDGARPPLSSTRPPPIPVAGFAWEPDEDSRARWTSAPPTLAVDALAPATPGSVDAGARYLAPVHDDVPPTGSRASDAQERGESEAADLVLSLEARLDALEEGAELSLAVSEQGDLFWLVIESAPGSGGRRAGRAHLRRAPLATPLEAAELAFLPLDLPLGEAPLRLRLANLDNHLRAWIDGAQVFDVPYEANRFAPQDTSFEGTSPGPRALLRVRGLRGRLRPELARDLQYLPRGRFGVAQPLQLGPDQLFLLGDNSSHSRDSREWGPVGLDQLVGRPLLVLWPPSSWRRPDAERLQPPPPGRLGSR